MDFKSIMKQYFGIALAVVIGIAFVVMCVAFMAPEGLIEGFTQELITMVTTKVKELIK